MYYYWLLCSCWVQYDELIIIILAEIIEKLHVHVVVQLTCWCANSDHMDSIVLIDYQTLYTD